MKKNLVFSLLFLLVLAAGTWFYFQNGEYTMALRTKSAPISSAKSEAVKAKAPKEEAPSKTSTASAKDTNKNKRDKSEKDINKEEKANEARAVASAPHNKRGKNWKTSLSRRLSRQLRAYKAEPKIKSLGSATINIGSSTQVVEHVLISIDKGDGNVSSYEAHIHPKTGSVLRTWNQTRFEVREPLALKLKPFYPSP